MTNEEQPYDHPEDWITEWWVNIYDIATLTRIQSPINFEESKVWDTIIKVNGHDLNGQQIAMNVGGIKIWLSGSIRYVGPPERSRENKYNKA